MVESRDREALRVQLAVAAEVVEVVEHRDQPAQLALLAQMG